MQYRYILLIDDDEDDQEIFTTALMRVSARVAYECMTNAKEALGKLVAGELKPDLIFLDLNMPIMNGQEFLREVKQIDTLAKIPVIIFSTSSNASTIEAARQLGAKDFITKPNRFDELVAILASQLSVNL